MPIPRKARDRQLRFQLDSVREHPPRDMSSSENGHCYSGTMLVGDNTEWDLWIVTSLHLDHRRSNPWCFTVGDRTAR
eukprot:gene26411-biopygen16348